MGKSESANLQICESATPCVQTLGESQKHEIDWGWGGGSSKNSLGRSRETFVRAEHMGRGCFSRWLEAVTTLYQFALSDGGGGWAVHQEDVGWWIHLELRALRSREGGFS